MSSNPDTRPLADGWDPGQDVEDDDADQDHDVEDVNKDHDQDVEDNDEDHDVLNGDAPWHSPTRCWQMMMLSVK